MKAKSYIFWPSHGNKNTTPSNVSMQRWGTAALQFSSVTLDMKNLGKISCRNLLLTNLFRRHCLCWIETPRIHKFCEANVDVAATRAARRGRKVILYFIVIAKLVKSWRWGVSPILCQANVFYIIWRTSFAGQSISAALQHFIETLWHILPV